MREKTIFSPTALKRTMVVAPPTAFPTGLRAICLIPVSATALVWLLSQETITIYFIDTPYFFDALPRASRRE
jgi:hypothetical protein